MDLLLLIYFFNNNNLPTYVHNNLHNEIYLY